jgi:hypothetical protein
MPKEITREDLLRKQEAMVRQIQDLNNERDADRITEISRKLESDAKDLEVLAKDFERQELAKAGPPPRGSLEVVLTEGQRKRVYDATGVKLDTLIVRDESGVLNQSMPRTDPRRIEQMAIAEARRRKISTDGDVKLREEVQQVMADIEAQGTGAVRELLDELKRDPNFLGGLLNKK